MGLLIGIVLLIHSTLSHPNSRTPEESFCVIGFINLRKFEVFQRYRKVEIVADFCEQLNNFKEGTFLEGYGVR